MAWITPPNNPYSCRRTLRPPAPAAKRSMWCCRTAWHSFDILEVLRQVTDTLGIRSYMLVNYGRRVRRCRSMIAVDTNICSKSPACLAANTSTSASSPPTYAPPVSAYACLIYGLTVRFATGGMFQSSVPSAQQAQLMELADGTCTTHRRATAGNSRADVSRRLRLVHRLCSEGLGPASNVEELAPGEEVFEGRLLSAALHEAPPIASN